MSDRKFFRRTATKVKKINISSSRVYRGGIRL